MRRAPAIVSAVAALGAVSAEAQAGTAKMISVDSCRGDTACSKYGGGTPVPVAVFQGAPGEANRVVARVDGASIVIHDDGAPVAASDGCSAVDERTARCPLGGADAIEALSVALMDGDDEARVEGDLGRSAVLDGGGGRDAITGGAEADRLPGGPGADRLDGGSGRDVVQADRRDRLRRCERRTRSKPFRVSARAVHPSALPL